MTDIFNSIRSMTGEDRKSGLPKESPEEEEKVERQGISLIERGRRRDYGTPRGLGKGKKR